MKKGEKREQWGSKLGFILAAAGSAVGLGNIWKFSYTAGENGGGAFIIIYLLMAFSIGLSIMIGEFALGRMAQSSPIGAYKNIDKRFTFAGVLGVLSAFLILGFYFVIGGWSLAYIFKTFDGLISNTDAIGDIFGNFVSDPFEPIFWLFVYLAINIAIVSKGVKDGIEKLAKFLMPALFILLIILSIRSITLPGASKGLEFLFKPDFSTVDGTVVLAALGQAFFSLSLGMGIMITYGSYINKKENLVKNSLIVVTIDSLIAILAGVAIFPALFSFGMEPAAGPGLVFVVVPKIFANYNIVIGVIMSFIFFLALTVAALTSSVSLLETVTSYLIDEKKMERKKAVGLLGVVLAILSVLSSLSMGYMSNAKILGATVFDILDLLTDKIFLAIAGMLMAIFMGFFMKKSDLRKELTNEGKVKFRLFNIWFYFMKYIIPILIAIVAFMGISSSENTGVMAFGIFFIVILGLISKEM